MNHPSGGNVCSLCAALSSVLPRELGMNNRDLHLCLLAQEEARSLLVLQQRPAKIKAVVPKPFRWVRGAWLGGPGGHRGWRGAGTMLWACERLCCIFAGEMLDYPHWERTSFLREILLLGWESRGISQMNPLGKFTE